MEIILLKRVLGLGQIGDTVKVKPGYARNFLLPRSHALRATRANQAVFAERRSHLETQNLSEKKEATSVAKKLGDTEVVIIRQASDSGTLYGSVTTRNIVDGLAEQNITVHRSQIRLDEKIKLVGIHRCRVVLHAEVISTISINIARSEDESRAQRKALENPVPVPNPVPNPMQEQKMAPYQEKSFTAESKTDGKEENAGVKKEATEEKKSSAKDETTHHDSSSTKTTAAGKSTKKDSS